MSTQPQTPPIGRLHNDASTELSARRTGMSFQRTRLSADRTLMSVIRTALSLIGFGFTIFQFFHKLQAADAMKSGAAPRHFGQALVWLGITILVLGIAYHVQFMLGLRKEREQMRAEGLWLDSMQILAEGLENRDDALGPDAGLERGLDPAAQRPEVAAGLGVLLVAWVRQHADQVGGPSSRRNSSGAFDAFCTSISVRPFGSSDRTSADRSATASGASGHFDGCGSSAM